MVNPIPDEAGYILDEYDAERFWAHVNRHSGTPYEDDPLATAKGECWRWRTTKDYAVFKFAGRQFPAHRVAYRDFGLTLTDTMTLDHLCRIHNCVNPAHLEPVTQRENVGRGKRGRQNRPNCSKGHPYDDENTIIVHRADGVTFRKCRKCDRIRKSEARRRGTQAAA